MEHEQTLIVRCPECGVGVGLPCRPCTGSPTRAPYNPKFYSHKARHMVAKRHLEAIALNKALVRFNLVLHDAEVRDSVAFKNDMCAVEIIITKYGDLDNS